MESLVTGIVDMFPGYLRPRRRQFTTCVCVVLFLLGAPMTMEGGVYLFQLMDFYREEREGDNMKPSRLSSVNFIRSYYSELEFYNIFTPIMMVSWCRYPNDSASGIPILWCCFFQTIAIGWIFGVRRFAACVEQMTGYKPSLYWIATWGYIAPIVMAVRIT